MIVEEISFISFKDNILSFYIKCHKGTYIRSIARDIAYTLNTYGHLIKLSRTAVGPYNKDNTVSINGINQCLNS